MDELRLLLVEDEPNNRQALARDLRAWSREHGVAIDVCASANEAIAMLQEREYAVLLTDNRMPGISGTELVRIAAHVQPTMSRLMLTGYPDRRDVADALAAGLFSFLVKPWDREVLVGELTQALRAFRLKRTHATGNRDDSEPQELARRLHRLFAEPSLPKTIGGFAPQVAYRSASSGRSGNDIVDLRVGPDGAAAILVGDVAGSGMRATYVAALLKGALIPEYLAHHGWVRSPAHLLAWLNTRIADIVEEYPDVYLVAGVVTIDPQARAVAYASAGLPQPVVCRARTAEPVDAYGVALGIREQGEYANVAIDLRPGDVLYLYTDGLYVPGRTGHRLERAQILDALSGADSIRSTSGIVDHLIQTADAQTLETDMTLLSLARESR